MLLLRYSDVRVRLREQVALEVWFVTVRNFRNFRNDNGSYFIDEYLKLDRSLSSCWMTERRNLTGDVHEADEPGYCW